MSIEGDGEHRALRPLLILWPLITFSDTHLDRTVEDQRRRRGRAPYGGGAGVETALGNTDHRLGLAELAKHGVDGIEGGIDLLPDLNGW